MADQKISARTPASALTGTESFPGIQASGEVLILISAILTYINANASIANFTGNLAGDVTGAQGSTTVIKINGVTLSSLATGILKNTTGTGAPSIAVAADFPTLNQSTTGSAATLTTPRAIAGKNFDGSTPITIASTDLSDTASIALLAATQTLTNKRVTARIGTVASSATPAINTDSFDQFNITALAAAITSLSSSLTGTPNDGDTLIIRIKDNGTARAITHGASFVSSGAAPLLTTTVISKTHTEGFRYDAASAKWVCLFSDPVGY